jgi:hypothetical protein
MMVALKEREFLWMRNTTIRVKWNFVFMYFFVDGSGIAQSVELLATGWTTEESQFESQ